MSEQRSGLDQFAIGFAEAAIRFRWLVILLSLVGAGFMASGIQHLAFSNNYRAFFSEENPELRNFEEFQATYTKSDNFLFVFVPKDGSSIFTNENLAAIGEFTEKAWLIPYSSRVDSLTNFQYTYAIGDELIVEDLIVDPGNSTPEELASRRAAALAEPLLANQLITDDAGVTSVNVVLTYPEKSLSEVPEAVEAARALRSEILESYPQFDIYLTGTSMLNNAFSEAVQSDFAALIPIMFIVIIVTTIVSVRSVGATLSTLLLVALSSAAAMGWAGFVGIQLAGPSPSATIVILTLAIADSVHILMSMRASMRAGLEQRAAVIDAIRINFLAVSTTSLTTMVGFMALNFSDSPPFRDLGNISAVGIFFAWLFSLTLLPALLSIIPIRVKTAKSDLGEGFLSGFAIFVVRAWIPLFLLTGAASIALIRYIPELELSDQFRYYFDQRIEFRTDSDAATEYFGFYPLEVSMKAGEPGGVSDPEFLQKLDAFSDWLREQPEVTHVYSIADIMKRLNKNLNGDDPDFYALPNDRDLSAQYLLLFELSLPYGLDLNDRINVDKSATRITATLDGEMSSRLTRGFLKKMEAWFAQNAPEYASPATGPQVMFTFIAQRNVESMVLGTTLAVGVIAIIMIFALRSIPMGLLSIVPNGLPILSAFGAWALLVGDVGLSVAAVASISLGIVIDDTVHFLMKYQRGVRERGLDGPAAIRYAFQTVGAAILVNTFILASGFMVLTLSAFKINLELGLLTTLTIGFALVLDFLFLPGLLLMITRKPKSDA